MRFEFCGSWMLDELGNNAVLNTAVIVPIQWGNQCARPHGVKSA